MNTSKWYGYLKDLLWIFVNCWVSGKNIFNDLKYLLNSLHFAFLLSRVVKVMQSKLLELQIIWSCSFLSSKVTKKLFGGDHILASTALGPSEEKVSGLLLLLSVIRKLFRITLLYEYLVCSIRYVSVHVNKIVEHFFI